MGVLPVEYYNASMQYINARLTKPSYYIFSDDLEWAKQHLTMEGDKTFVDIDGGTSENLELELMSKCSHNIIANSSFSWWGAFLNKNPSKIVIAPRHWVKDKEINNRIELQFPTWIKM
jgi:hypothetical protein